jgi:hypothetical protein
VEQPTDIGVDHAIRPVEFRRADGLRTSTREHAVSTTTAAACKRCGDADAQAAWAAWWQRLDLPVLMPPETECPWCPMCMTGLEEIAFLTGCRGTRVLFADRFPAVAARIDERLRALLAAQSEAES